MSMSYPPQQIPGSAMPYGMPPQGPMAPNLPGPPGAAGGQSGPELGDFIRILKQRKLTIIITTILLSIITTGTTLVLYRYYPGYRASALLNVVPPRQNAYELVNPLVDPRQMELPAATEAQRIKQPNLLAKVLEMPEVKSTSFYREYDKLEECLQDLQTKLSSGVVRDTTLIRVSFMTKRRDEAITIVDAVVSRYLAITGSDSRTEVTSRIEGMRTSRAGVIEELDSKRRELQNFRQQTDVPALETERASISTVLGDLKQRLALNQEDKTRIESQYETISNYEPWQLPITPEMEVTVNQDPILRFRREQVESLELEMQALLTAGVLGEDHRQINLLKQRKALFQEAESSRREELYDQLREQQQDSLQQALAQTRAVELKLLERIQEEEARQRDLDRNIQKFNDMQDDRDRIEQRLAQIEMQISEAEQMSRSNQNLRRVELAQRADAPPVPTWPNRRLFIAGGFFMSLAGGIGLAFLLEFADKAIRTPIDIARHAHVSVLGCIPRLDDEEAEEIEDIERAALVAPQSLVAESFRQVRTNLLFSGPLESQRSLLITSPGPDDGKSTVAINLAVTLARGGASVLLIDANFRRPALREAFQRSKSDGLSNVLIGQRSFDDVLVETESKNLYLLASGPMPPTPAELLGAESMRNLLEEASKRFDRIIIDGPPVLLMSDALVLAAQIDGVLLVSRAASNTKGELRRANEQLQRIGARVIGAVLNGIEARPGGYFRRQYREFYDYVSDETVPPELPAFDDDQADRTLASGDQTDESDPFDLDEDGDDKKA
jgi:succinoglycan biosynthesis transport protein ExoP